MTGARGPVRWTSPWSSDRALSVLLTSLVALIFVIPTVHARPEAVLLAQFFFTLIFGSGLIAGTKSRAARFVGAVVFTAAIVVNWLDYLKPGAGLDVWTALARVVGVGLLTSLVPRHVTREGPITFRRIQGAVAVYLLLGLGWAGVYELIRSLSPDAFRFVETPPTRTDARMSLAYYSFVTLTTMGYGDITPVNPAARSAAILEGLTGQIFPAILIARLVAQELAARERR